MNIILLEKVANLGNLGDKVSVKSGYGRNFLIPGGKAVLATVINKHIKENHKDMQKSTIYYAIEKLPKNTRQKILELNKKIQK